MNIYRAWVHRFFENLRDVLADTDLEYRAGGIDGESTVQPVKAALSEGRHFVLVETSRYGQTWVTFWKTAQEAVDYHATQEYPDDWDICELQDLTSGARYGVRYTAVPRR